MDENEVLGVDAEPETGTEGENTGEEVSGVEGEVSVEETGEIVIDTSEFAAEIAVLEEKFDILTGQVTVLTDKVTGCYCMLLILAVLGLKNLFSRRIVRKVRGGMDDV